MLRFEYEIIHYKNRAFTLIEVLIVLIIIAALAGLLYIAFGGSSESAKKAACEGEREKIKNAYAMQRYASGGNFQTAIKTVMDDVPQASADSSPSNNGVLYVGLCKDGGSYDIRPASTSVLIRCYIHGGDTLSVDVSSGGGAESVYKIPGTHVAPTLALTTYADYIKNITSDYIINGNDHVTINYGGANDAFYITSGYSGIIKAGQSEEYYNALFKNDLNTGGIIHLKYYSADSPTWQSIKSDTSILNVNYGDIVSVVSGDNYIYYYTPREAAGVSVHDSQGNYIKYKSPDPAEVIHHTGWDDSMYNPGLWYLIGKSIQN